MRSHDTCYLYHICREKDKYNLSVGYIGISRSPRKRWTSGGYKQNPHLWNALKKYDDVIFYVIACSTSKGCVARERKLRPRPNMGWNIAPGGGLPPSPKGKKHCISNLPPEKRRKVYIVTDEARAKMRRSQSKRSGEFRKRMLENNPTKGLRGRECPKWKGWYMTPDGCFDSREVVAEFYGISTMTVTRRCVTGGKVGRSRHNPPEWVGKTWEELGWYFKEDPNGNYFYRGKTEDGEENV